MNDKESIDFSDYLIKLGAKKNWFTKHNNMGIEFYFERKIDGFKKKLIVSEIGIKSQSIFSKIIDNNKNYLPMDKIFPKDSKNLYSFNCFHFHETHLPYYDSSYEASLVLKSKDSFEVIAKNFHLAINDIDNYNVNNPKEENEDVYKFDLYEEILNKYNIFVEDISYPESYDVDNETLHGIGGLKFLGLDDKKIYFLNKPYLDGEYYFLWGNDNEEKYFLPLDFLIETKWVSVKVYDF